MVSEASELWFGELFNSSALGIVISQLDGRIVRTNPALDEILGYSEGELPGLELSELFMPGDLPAVAHGYQRLLDGDELRFRSKVRLFCKDGETAWTQLTVSVLRDVAQAPRYLATMEDITEVHLLRERLNHQALHDLQTGLPNRHYFLSHLEEVLGRLEPSAVVTLVHLDLDGFSVINDGLGHPFGDRLLNTVARRLESVVAQQRAMVARIGGDEYAILLEPGETVPAVGALAEAINTELAETLYLDDLGVAVTASMGVVQQQAGAMDPADLLRAAAATLRRLRGSKRQWAVFDADIDAADRAELRLAATMPGALETGELQLQFQPVVTLEGGWLVGVEAVLSWQHPQLGTLSHDRCIQLAERTGVGHAVGRWALQAAAEQARSWQDQLGPGLPPIMINLAPSHAQDPDLVAQVRAALLQTGLRPAALEVRVPVGTVHPGGDAHAGGDAEENLQVLADLGVRTSLHDFGADLGGLTCLARPWVHTVRIGPSVARQVAGSPGAVPARALSAVVSTIRTAGISVVACAVDTEKLAEWWRGVGADCAVGALFGPPSTPQHIAHLLGLPAGTAHAAPDSF